VIDQFAVLENDTPVHNNLEVLRSRVVDGQWKYSATTPESTLHSIYKCLYSEEVVKRCKCKLTAGKTVDVNVLDVHAKRTVVWANVPTHSMKWWKRLNVDKSR
jgi:hypothetical protein